MTIAVNNCAIFAKFIDEHTSVYCYWLYTFYCHSRSIARSKKKKEIKIQIETTQGNEIEIECGSIA